MFLLFLLFSLWFREARLASSPRVLFHVTDVHLSTHERLLPFGSIRSDLDSFVRDVVNPISPDAVIVSGDLVDAKDMNGAGLQYEEEALAWSSIEKSMDTTVLTVPGNHDRFDKGLESGEAKRVSVRVLMRDGRVVQDGGGECPNAILLGIDASPRVGLRSPANFLALTTDADIEVLRKQISAIDRVKAQCAGGREPLVLGYGHYPLSLFSRAHSVGLMGALSHAFGGMDCLDHPIAELIARKANVYLCGHLHSLFGRLQRVHEVWNEDGGRMSGLHELEAAAWKDQRSFRVLVVDEECLSFADYYFLTPTSPQYVARRAMDLEQRQRDGWESSFALRGWGLTSHGAGFSLHGAMVVITSPPDAFLPDMCGSTASSPAHHRHDVRALALVPALKDGDVISARAIFSSVDGQEIGSLKLIASDPSDRSKQLLFVGDVDVRLAERLRAASVYHLRVEVRSVSGDASNSFGDGTDQIIGLSPPRTISADSARIPLEQNLIEFITLHVNWANFATRLYLMAISTLISVLAFCGTGFRRGALIGYLLAQLTGPLYACRLLSESWPFLAFQHGVLGYVNGQFIVVPTADTLLVATMQVVFCLFPMSVWVIVFGSQAAGTRSGFMRLAKWVSLGLIVLLNVAILWRKLLKLSGMASLLLSPGVTWAIPVFLWSSSSARVRMEKISKD